MQTTTKPMQGYTQNAWQGVNYESGLDIKEIAKRIRTGMAIKYPGCKFSIRISRYAGGQSMDIRLMSADFPIFAKVDLDICRSKIRYPLNETAESIAKSWQTEIDTGRHDVNHYWLEEDYRLTKEAKEMFSFLKGFINSYNFDDSDGMIDYFHTNFYYSIQIGHWEKPFIQK